MDDEQRLSCFLLCKLCHASKCNEEFDALPFLLFFQFLSPLLYGDGDGDDDYDDDDGDVDDVHFSNLCIRCFSLCPGALRRTKAGKAPH